MNGTSPIVARLVAAALLLSPALMRAQNAPPTPSASSIGVQVPPAQVFGKLLSNYEGEIVSAAEAMPDDKYTFAPTTGEFKGVRTFADQVKHLAQANYGMYAAFGVSGGRDPKSLDSLTSKADLVQALKDSYAYARRAVDSITAANAFEEVQMGQRKGTRAGLATLNIAHANDHYGQMVEYLRMNGIVPPASRK